MLHGTGGDLPLDGYFSRCTDRYVASPTGVSQMTAEHPQGCLDPPSPRVGLLGAPARGLARALRSYVMTAGSTTNADEREAVLATARRAKDAAVDLATASRAAKDAALIAMADALVKHADVIVEANAKDVAAGEGQRHGGRHRRPADPHPGPHRGHRGRAPGRRRPCRPGR